MMILVQPNSCGNSGFRFRSVLFLVSEFSDSFGISFSRFFPLQENIAVDFLWVFPMISGFPFHSRVSENLRDNLKI
ncbi:hypothetical protein M6B38_246425 [Iris pallida]|uniref:Uncharacterized protein n=1 Tax=Iris pallida TaxID=29817 RepID=A0AAX6DFE5_IRIPA|nr:hypothetical protein M6B38_249190 [Iris pallida]KAJ6790459.1 hypothetical protein M6B38_249195 [Iris pallida]KAJ6790896.1 hypothetical protein M6B38_246420 [Iris pallida]KAJ6790897.1 hypothetical protein M6B38_246425 [Iris pallida]